MVKNQVVMSYKDYERLHQHLCNIAGYIRASLSATRTPRSINTVEQLLACLETVRNEANEALDLLNEEE